MHAVFRSAFGRVLTVAIGAICAVTAVVIALEGERADLLGFAPWLALLSGACWATFWRPCVEVSDGGVRLVNVTRTIDVPWPAITGIETRWALTLITAYGKFTAWAAPAPGRGAMRKATRVDPDVVLGRAAGAHAPSAATEVPPGPAGQAAEIVQAHWERLRAAGHLDNPVLEHERVPVRWHIGTLVAGVVLVGLGIAGLME
jgi:Bacterial PH domain